MNNVYIKQINIKNFQSWKNQTINLIDGFNVIRSDDNSAGKSVVMKAIKIALCPNVYTKEERKKMIRDNTEYAEAIFVFSDNTISMVRVLPTKTLHYYHDGESWSQRQDAPFAQTVQKIGGIVDFNNGLIANLLDMDQPLLLIKSDNKSNHALIELITHHEELSRITPIFREKWNTYSDKRSELNFAVKSLENQISNSQFVDVNKMRKDIARAEDILPALSDLVDSALILENSQRFAHNMKDFDFLLGVLNDIEPLIEANELELNIPKELPEEVDLCLDMMDTCIELDNLLDIEIPMELDDSVLNAAELMVDLEEAIDLIDIDVPDIDHINILDSLLDIREDIVSIQTDYVEDLMYTRKHLINCHTLLGDISNSVKSLVKSDFEISQIEHELKIKGAGAMCPIYGAITIKDDKCYNLVHIN